MFIMTKTVTEILNTKYPLIQGPMAWLTDAKLVAAVCNAGGLGVLGTNAGQNTVTRDATENAERLRHQIHKVKKLTDKDFGVNILTASPDEKIDDDPFMKGFLDVAFEEHLKYYVVVGAPNEAVFQAIKAHDGIIIFRPMTPTIATMVQAEALGADILVATGRDEGGILPAQEYGTFTVVPTMVDAVSIPVLAAGGINDKRGVNAALALGAQGVFIGTRFLATKEAPTAENVKELMIKSTYHDLTQVSASQRSLKTGAAQKLAQDYQQNHDGPKMDEAINALGGLLPAMVKGDVNAGIITSNTGIDLIRDIPTVAELIDRLMVDYKN
ncbi:hypothetical protein FC83_GL001443 [Agrilactobacillus composti DSM 18527 = JCM 14202]|uniref:Probable nitronate monooxygenase n=2 Tax=Agrilactobacillus TaxID=2767875 RepID=X0QQA2_9LACO|nr:hypothetical protein FC83_GL001443 [Agrilactobacillus composti DSM 18527 = JCM 14202]GAF40815.1 enoyl-[acyl-carrier-protein] reductase [Agrilactobacillus composti DSM 18527 = JCM 14202]